MVLIDTNYIIRFLTMTPPEHFEKAKELFYKVAKKELEVVVSEGIIMECYFVLSKFYKWEKNRIIEKLEKILNFHNVICNEKFILLETLNILKDKNIDFIDALLCAKSNLLGYEVKSFDNDIKKCLKK